MTRDGNSSDDARQKMFLSAQTYEGLKIAVSSHIEAIKFFWLRDFSMCLLRGSCKMSLRITLDTKEKGEEDQTTHLPINLGAMI